MQLPRVRVYRTVRGRLVVDRTWPAFFGLEPTFSPYPDLETMVRDRHALATTWITEEDALGQRTDLTPHLVKALRKSLGRRPVLAIDDLDPADMKGRDLQVVRIGKDTETIRRALGGKAD